MRPGLPGLFLCLFQSKKANYIFRQTFCVYRGNEISYAIHSFNHFYVFRPAGFRSG
jgi:hypothetical protein